MCYLLDKVIGFSEGLQLVTTNNDSGSPNYHTQQITISRAVSVFYRIH
jgi:hypothetical protein